ncbi:MAG: hypothetical protein ACREUQ_07360 [Burkholderiales bacterium]
MKITIDADAVTSLILRRVDLATIELVAKDATRTVSVTLNAEALAEFRIALQAIDSTRTGTGP